jgi:hypothetical protein
MPGYEQAWQGNGKAGSFGSLPGFFITWLRCFERFTILKSPTDGGGECLLQGLLNVSTD